MSGTGKALRKALSRTVDDLPVGVYQVDDSGRLLFCNKVARELLGIPLRARDLREHTITSFYSDPKARSSLLRRLAVPGSQVVNETIPMVVKGEELFVSDSCRQLYDKSGRRTGWIGVLTDVTELVTQQKMLEELPVAVYYLDADGRFLRVNPNVARIFAFSSDKEILGRNVRDLFVHEDDFNKILSELKAERVIANRVVSMRRADGMEIAVQVSEKALFRNRELVGRLGSFTDVTEAHRYFQALENLPTGYYRVEERDGQEVIVQCNPAFAKIMGYESEQEVVGKLQISSLYYEGTERERFLQKLAERMQAAESVLGHRLRLRRKDGTPVIAAVDARLVFDRLGNVIGREGTVRDITKQVSLEQKVYDLQTDLERTTQDMDHFMHRYVAPILRVDAGLQVQERMLSCTRRQSAHRRNDTEVGSLGDDLEASLEKALELRNSGEREISHLLGKLRTLKTKLARRHELNSWILDRVLVRETAIAVMDELKSLTSESAEHTHALGGLRQSAVRVLDEELLRNAKVLRAETAALNTVIESLRRYLFTGDKVEYDFRESDLVRLVSTYMEMYAPMAAERKLALRYSGPKHLRATIAETHVSRAVSNLLLNAIKYSYKGPDRFVLVEGLECADSIELRISNYGVPITEDEIESGKLFEYGYRGSLSRDYNRTGSGVGLADVKETIEMHYGIVKISSRPAMSDAEPNDYSVPFLTTATIILPRVRPRDD